MHILMNMNNLMNYLNLIMIRDLKKLRITGCARTKSIIHVDLFINYEFMYGFSIDFILYSFILNLSRIYITYLYNIKIYISNHKWQFKVMLIKKVIFIYIVFNLYAFLFYFINNFILIKLFYKINKFYIK